jgi:hypothetical protein
MGAVLSFRLAANLAAAGLDPATVQYTELIDPLARATVAVTSELRLALAGAIHGVFIVAFLAAALALLVTTFAPRGRIAQIVEQRGLDQSGRPAQASVAAEAKQPAGRV